jgi:hypothetical protein
MSGSQRERQNKNRLLGNVPRKLKVVRSKGEDLT